VVIGKYVPNTLPYVYTSGSNCVLFTISASNALAVFTPPLASSAAAPVVSPSPPAARISRLYVTRETSTPAARMASKASNANLGRPALEAASMSNANVRAFGAIRPSSDMRWKISNAASGKEKGQSSRDLHYVITGGQSANSRA
jgi:hypothetical protein